MTSTTIIGNLTRDPESASTSTGKTVCHFTVAVNKRQKNADGSRDADFFRVSAFGQMGDACQRYLAKGKKVAVRGQVSAHAFTAKDGQPGASLEIFAEDVEFLTPSGQSGSSEPAQEQASGFIPVEEESLPF